MIHYPDPLKSLIWVKEIYEIVATVYDKKGRVLAKEKNSYSKSHPLQAKYAAKVGLCNNLSSC